jgi:4'-phosphopantetheinyl transferase
MSAITLGPTGVLAWTGDDAPADPLWLADLHPAAGYHAAVAGTGARPEITEERGDGLLAAQAL